MIPLAITSTTGWIRRLGGRWWNRLHRLVYVTGVCGVVHFLWLVKVVETEQITYAVILAVLLGLRIWWSIAKRLAPATAPARQTIRSAG
jgi:sulfoxide reductase heme-binding subunit YedZ